MNARTARILYPFAGGTVGGSHISTALIIRHLNPADYSPVIVLEGAAPLQKTLLEQHDLRSENADIWIPKSFKDLIVSMPRYIKSVLKARRLIKEKRADLVHCDDGPARYVWFYASLLAGVPYLHVQRTILKPGLEKTLSFRLLAGVAVNSETTRKSLPPLPAGTAQDTIAPLIDLSVQTQPRAFPAHRPLTVGYLSNMYAQKRPDVFLRAAKILQDAQPGAFRFVMAGAFYQDWESRVKELAGELGIAVTYTGFTEQPLETLKPYDLLIAPAEHEAFGRVVVEAMALGIPVIAARDGGHCEIIQDGQNGYLCKPGKAEDFAAKALQVLNDKTLYEGFSKAGLETARRYEAAALSGKFQALYKKILEGDAR